MGKQLFAIFVVTVATLVLVISCGQGSGDDEDESADDDDFYFDGDDDGGNSGDNDVDGVPEGTKPDEPGEAFIESVGTLLFEPEDVNTVRPDLFNPGYFSIFDLLVYFDELGLIDLEYHFEKSMDTHIVDRINGDKYWWYQVWYDGGWAEDSVHRMDYYPVKDKMHIAFFETTEFELDDRKDIWRTETIRRQGNSGEVIIPVVTIRHPGGELEFNDVPVTPHNLRSDFFAEDVITAADIIMSLGDQGKITYELLWYETINSFEIDNYYVERINSYAHSGMCGFVYEVGESDDRSGNHIHVVPDIRILHSPQYALFYWIELGPC